MTFEKAPAKFRAQRFEDTIGITTVRLTAVRDGKVEATRDFAAADRQGELVNLAEGVYEVRVEGLVGSDVVLRAVKTGVVVETAKVRDAGEFFLAPVAPQAPVLTRAPAAVTNVAGLRLEGRKEMFTGIRVNGNEAAPPDDQSAFALTHALAEGANAVKLTAFTEEGNESAALTLNITLDRTPPQAVSFTIAGAPAAVSNPTVNLLIAATDAADMMIAADAAFAGGVWIAYETGVTLTLADFDGLQTLYVKFRDRAGNESAALSTSVVLDRVGPGAPSVQVAQGAFVNTLAVTLNLAASGAAEMQLSEDAAFAGAAWAPFAATAPFTLSAGDGLKTVYARFRDAAGNVSATKQASVTLDTALPAVSLSLAGAPTVVSATTVTFTLSGALADATEMEVVEGAFTGAWTAFSASGMLTLSGADGVKTISARVRDAAGNISNTATYNVTLDTTAPNSPGVSVSGVPPAVATPNVTLIFSVLGGATEMQVSEDSTFSGVAWVAYVGTTAFTLSGGDGTKTVYARFRDAAGNASATAWTNVVLDTTPPASPAVALAGAPAAVSAPTVTLNLSATGAPVDMQTSEDPAFAGASWVAYAATAPFTLSGGDGVKTIYARFRDGVGNLSANAAVVVELDTTAPAAASVIANGGIAFTTIQSIAVDLAASGATEMQLDTSATFNGAVWQAFVTSTTFNLPAGQGAYTIYARFRDAVGNVSSPIASGSVTLDQSIPAVTVFDFTAVPNYTSNRFEPITLIASDVSALEMRFDFSPSFTAATAWAPYNASPSVDLGLTEGLVTLYVEVRDAAGNVNQAGPIMVTLDFTAPSTPSAVFATPNPSTGSFTLNWSPAFDLTSGISQYEIDESPDGFTWSPAGVTASSSFALVRTSGVYYYRLRAVDNAGLAGGYSASVSATVDTLPPVAGTVADGLGTDVQYQAGASSVAANWTGFTDDAGIVNYDVGVGSAPGLDDIVAFVAAGVTSSQTLGASLAEGQTVFVTVRAWDAAGNSVDASSDGVTVDLTPPGLPAAPGITPNPSDGNYTVTWGLVSDALSGVDHYEVWENGVPVTAVSGPPLVVSGAPQGSYTYQVLVVDVAGNASSLSAASPSVIVDQTPPTAPFGLGVTPNPSTGPVVVSWFGASDGETGVAGYIVETSPDSGTWTPVATTQSTSVALTFGEGTQYVRVLAYDGVGLQGPASAFVLHTVDSVPPLAGTVNDGVAADVAYVNSTVNVPANWAGFTDAGTGVVGYHMAVGSAPFGSDVVGFTDVASNTFYNLAASLSEGATYYVTVRAFDNAGNFVDAASNGFIVDATPPPAPAAPSVSPNPTTGPITITWSPVTDSVSGVAYYELLENGSPVPITTVAGTSFFIPAAAAGAYYYQVRAVDAAGNISADSAGSPAVTVDQTAPVAPWSMSVAPNPSTGPVTAMWFAGNDPETGVSGYIVETSPDSFIWSPYTTTTSTSVDMTLGQGVHYVRAIAFNGANVQSAQSDVFMVTIDQIPPTPGVVNDGAAADIAFSNNGFDVTANWIGYSDNVTIVGYKMAVGTTPFGTDVIPFTNVGLGPIATLSNALSEGITLYTTIRALDSAGNTADGSSNGFTVDLSAPPSPAAPAVSPNPATGGVTVSWAPVTDAISGVAHYEVWENSSPVTTVAGTSLYIPVPPEGAFYYEIRAFDAAGNASVLSPASATVIVDRTPPSAPSVVSLSPNPASGPVNVAWFAAGDTGSGVAGYIVETSPDGFTWSPAGTTQATSFLLTGLGDGTHYVRVIAYDYVGLQGPDTGGADSVIVDTLPPVPLSFSVAGPSVVNTTGVTFNVSANGADQMMLSEDPAFTAAFWQSYMPSTFFSLSPFDGVKTVYVRFRDFAGNESGTMAAGVTLDTTPPAAPATVNAFPSPTTTGFTVSWTAVSDATGISGYQLWENGSPVTTVAGTIFNLPSPPEGTYSYQVLAIDGAGNAGTLSGSSSTVIVDRSAPNTPAAPTFSANPVSGPVTVNWLAVGDVGAAGLQDYRLELSADGGVTWSLAAVTTSTAKFFNLPGGNFVFRVAAQDFAGNKSAFSPSSVNLAVSVSGPTSPYVAVEGSPAWVNTTNIKLLLSAVGATSYEVDEDPGFGTPQSGPMTASTNYTLSAGDGLKTVFARYFDGLNYSAVVSTAVSLDTMPPALTNATLASAVSTPTVTLGLAATGAFEMSVTGDAVAPRGWVPYQASSPITLATRSGKLFSAVGSASFARGVTVQSDGKILVAGYATNTADDWILVRYNADGTFDNTFGTSGKVTVDFGGLADFAYDVAVRGDGKIFVAGTYNNGSKGVATVMGFNADGTPYTAYGPNANGKTYLNIGGSTNDGFTRIAFDGLNRLYAVGWTFNGTTAYDAVLARFDASGSLDATFNGQGYVTRDIANGNQQAAALAFDGGGNIVVGGYTASDFLVMRYTMAGAADSTFNGTGYAATSVGANADTIGGITVQTDGRLLAVGQGNDGQNRIAMARYNQNGALDATFGAGTGTVLTSFSANDAAIGAAQLGDGKILIGGRAGNDFLTARFNADGSVDNTYGQGGWRPVDVLGFADTPAGFLLLGDKTAMVIGQANNGSQNHWAVVRVDEPTGKPFGGFGPLAEGVKTLYFGTRDQAGNLSSQLMRSVAFDKTPPTALAFSVLGSPAEVTTTNITLSTLMSESGQMQISESPGFDGAPWIAYNTTTPFSLSPSDGTKTIYIRFRDPAGNTSGSLSTSVMLRTFGLTSLSVGAGFDNDTVVITGFGFGASQGADFVRFGGSNASVMGWSDTQITVVVPTAAGPGSRPVTLDKGGSISNSLPFLVRPRIITASPGSGSAGDSISLAGYNFGISTATLQLAATPVSTSGWSMMNIGFNVPANVVAGMHGLQVFASGASSNTVSFIVGPKLFVVSPNPVQPGQSVTVTGSNLGASQGASLLQVGAFTATASAWNMNQLTFTVPVSAPAGDSNVVVTVNGYGSNAVTLTVNPVINSLTPVTATSGTTVSIAGNAFGAIKGGSQLMLGAAPTGEDAWSNTLITWTVPSGLPAGSYPIHVEVNGRSSNTMPFFVDPRITSLSAATAPVGSVVSLLGTNFGASQTSSTVTIGGQLAAVQAWSSSFVDVWVPTSLAPGNHPVIINVGGRASIPQPLTVTKADRLAYMTAPQGPVAAGVCSGAEGIELRDAFGIPAPATAAVTISLSAPTVRFYTDSGCFAETTSLVINPPLSSATFYYMGITAGTESMNASAAGLSGANQTATIMALAPTDLAFAGPVNIGAGQCSGYTVRSVDMYGNLSNVATSETVTLGGQGAGTFYTDPGCGTSGNVVTINAFSNSAQFWFRDMGPESLSFTASGGSLTGASYGVNVTAAAQPPSISQVTPAVGRPGLTVTINGANFGPSQGTSYVTFAGGPAPVLFWSPTTVQVISPYVLPGNIGVRVVVGDMASSPAAYENRQMHIDDRYPASGVSGSTVTLTGGYFGAVTGTVTVGGFGAAVQGWTDNTIQFTVPPFVASGNAVINVVDSAATHNVKTAITIRGASTWVGFEEVPEARYGHSALWTGAEMIVWGGESTMGVPLNTGARYNPALDSWVAMSMVSAPTARTAHAAVWAGRGMFVFGGFDGSTDLADLYSYDPWSDAWNTLPGDGLNARQGSTAVWTGRHLLVFGGTNSAVELSLGRSFEPNSQIWAALPSTNEPSPRLSHTAVWTGKEMIVWGGSYATAGLNDGARYDEQADQWYPIAATNAPDGRQNHTAVWTGSEMIVWGGYADIPPYERQDGASYNPQTNTWTAVAFDGNTPAGRDMHTAVWTGQEMIVFGGTGGGSPLNSGGAYRVTDQTWTPLPTLNAPLGRLAHKAVFTGSEMIVWGGDCGAGCVTSTGGRFNVVSKVWSPTAMTPGMPTPRSKHRGVWAGSQMVVWGGFDGTGYPNTGGRYNPATDQWMPTSTTGPVPAGRADFTMVWDGAQVLAWGGQNGTDLNSGGRYNPATDSWTSISTSNAPTSRSTHSAVWTGTEMVVWGGYGLGAYANTGAKYNPGLDGWTAVPTLNAPTARRRHTAVWTGSEMIVWGGYDGSIYPNTGARYYPAGNTWAATSTGANVPVGRADHTAVWSGTYMVVYGGTNGTALGSGARYEPAVDAWLTMPSNNARTQHTAVWNGGAMLVFGGLEASKPAGPMQCYDPSTNGWYCGADQGRIPLSRFDHTAVWTGTEMLIWGGNNGRYLSSGARYQY